MASAIIALASVAATAAIFYLTRNGRYNHSAGMFLAITALFTVVLSVTYGLAQCAWIGC